MANVVLIPNEMSGLNYSIAPSVASNDLTVAIKDAAGNNPTSASPCVFRVGGSERILSTSLSVTKADATNWANLGSAELATKEVDLFVYIVWNTNTSALDILWSRIPYATLYSDFSATTTNEKYGAINATAPASTDNVVNIGRFAATLSAGAGYTWTVPTFTSANLINRPIFSTRWLTYAPTVAGFSAVPTATIYEYSLNNLDVTVRLREGTAGTSNSTSFSYTAPFTAKTVTNGIWGIFFLGKDNSAFPATPSYMTIATGAASFVCFLTGASAAASWTASGTKQCFFAEPRYPIA